MMNTTFSIILSCTFGPQALKRIEGAFKWGFHNNLQPTVCSEATIRIRNSSRHPWLLPISRLGNEEEDKEEDKETHRERHSEECGGQELVYL